MCFSTPKPPAPPKPPEVQKPAEIEEGGASKLMEQKRNRLLIRKQQGSTGIVPTTSMRA